MWPVIPFYPIINYQIPYLINIFFFKCVNISCIKPKHTGIVIIHIETVANNGYLRQVLIYVSKNTVHKSVFIYRGILN